LSANGADSRAAPGNARGEQIPRISSAESAIRFDIFKIVFDAPDRDLFLARD
jgi:hypothetical protein